MPGPIEQTFLEMCTYLSPFDNAQLPAPHGGKNSQLIKPEGSHMVTALSKAWKAASSLVALSPLIAEHTPW